MHYARLLGSYLASDRISVEPGQTFVIWRDFYWDSEEAISATRAGLPPHFSEEQNTPFPLLLALSWRWLWLSEGWWWQNSTDLRKWVFGIVCICNFCLSSVGSCAKLPLLHHLQLDLFHLLAFIFVFVSALSCFCSCLCLQLVNSPRPFRRIACEPSPDPLLVHWSTDPPLICISYNSTKFQVLFNV